MKKSRIIEHLSGPATPQLPASHSREIGRIIVHWSYFEHCVQESIWELLQISEPAGRLTVREPRVTDRLEMLRDLMTVYNGSWDRALYKSVYTAASLLAAKRHLLAHGIWFHHKAAGEWHVQLTRGTWPKNIAELEAASKKIIPESVPISLDDLRSATKEIHTLIADLKRLRASATARPPPLPETHP